MSKPTLIDWHQHIPSYGGVAIMMVIQTLLFFILLQTLRIHQVGEKKG